MSAGSEGRGCGNREAAKATEWEVRTKFLRLPNPVKLGDRLSGWRVCWLGGWDQGRVFFVVMVERIYTIL